MTDWSVIARKTEKVKKGDTASQNTHHWDANVGLYVYSHASADSEGIGVCAVHSDNCMDH